MANQTRLRDREPAPTPDAEYPEPWTGYGASPTEMPLTGYAALLAAYAGVFGTAISMAASRRGLPERVGIADVLLFGVATHKIGRIVTKDWVTSPLRAPFTEYQESTGGGEVTERSRPHILGRHDPCQQSSHPVPPVRGVYPQGVHIGGNFGDNFHVI